MEEANERELPNTMTWTIRLSDDDPDRLSKLKIVYAITAIGAIAIGFVTKSVVLSVLCIVVVVGSTFEFISGRKYRLNERSAGSGANEIYWSDVKSVHVTADEVHLSPFRQESKLDAIRGVKLRIRNVSKESVLEYVRSKVGKDVQFLGE